MFTYEQEVFKGVTLWRFKAQGNAVHYIASMFQQGLINKEHITPHEFSNQLTITVLNSRRFAFDEDMKYYLTLESCIIDGYLDIKMLTRESRFVPSWYRYDCEDITQETWDELGITAPEYIEDYVYYGEKAYDDELEKNYEIINGVIRRKKEIPIEEYETFDDYDSINDIMNGSPNDEEPYDPDEDETNQLI